MQNLNEFKIDKSWTLFLDRDGVINVRLIDDYVKNLDEFEFLPGVPEAIAKFSKIFGRIFIVTNQRGIARKLMTIDDLNIVHNHMLKEIEKVNGNINKIYFCPHDRDESCGCRKPDIGMALKAKEDFQEVNFNKSIMIGDSTSDIEFGKNAGMITVHITDKEIKGLKASNLKEVADLLS